VPVERAGHLLIVILSKDVHSSVRAGIPSVLGLYPDPISCAVGIWSRYANQVAGYAIEALSIVVATTPAIIIGLKMALPIASLRGV
jgi:hypothetical protein